MYQPRRHFSQMHTMNYNYNAVFTGKCGFLKKNLSHGGAPALTSSFDSATGISLKLTRSNCDLPLIGKVVKYVNRKLTLTSRVEVYVASLN